jgi:hypothetical protein
MGWPRYAVALVGIGSLFASVLLCDVLRAVPSRLRVGLLPILAAPVAYGIALHLGDLAHPAEPAANEMTELVRELVEPESSIESFEWELDVFGLQRVHHPARCVSCPAVAYDVPANVRYLVDGPASKVAELYRQELAEHRYLRLSSVGPYDFYRREQSR